MSCARGCRWDARVLLWGLSRRRNFWDSRAAADLTRCLPGAPIHACLVDGEGFVHPDHLGAADRARHVAGTVETAWIDARAVYARLHLAHDRAALRRGLLAMERDRVLVTGLGVSIWAYRSAGADTADGIRVITGVSRVAGLDIVMNPTADGRLLRSVEEDQP